MKKVLILGSGGSGKTTFALKLAEKSNLPLYHLDALYWKPNRMKPEMLEWKKIVTSIIERDTWIIDGSYFDTLSLRVLEADTIVFLDIPNYHCIWNILIRRIKYAKWTRKTRPGLASHTSEKIYFTFLKWVWFYQKKEKPKVFSTIERFKNDEVKIYVFDNYKSLYQFAIPS